MTATRVAIFLAFVLVATACGSDEVSSDATTTSTAPTATTSSAAATTTIPTSPDLTTSTKVSPGGNETEDVDGGFVVVFPTGDETCATGDASHEITGVEPLTLTFVEGGTLVATGSVTCDAAGTALVATLSGEGTWDGVAETFQLDVLFGYDEAGYTEFRMAGTIDRENGTIESEGQQIPISSIDG